MKYLNNHEIKSELLNMLSNLDTLFKENNITYSIMSGTLLGAVRHNGFIPWDDDIDIGMHREEYNRFLKLIKSGVLDHYGYVAIGGELRNGNLPFIKIVNKKIRVEEEDFHAVENACLWIDIFPFDYIKLSDIRSKLNNIAFVKKLLYKKIYQIFGYYRYKRGMKKLYYLAISTIFAPINKYFLIDKIISLSNYCKDRQLLIADLTWGIDDSKKCVPSYLFDDLVDYQFENITVKGFKDYDTYLTCIYGDYMKLPPEDQRVNHGIKAWRVNSDEE